MAATRTHQARDHIERGAFARSVWPQKTGHEAGFDLQGKLINRQAASESLGHFFECQCRRRFGHGWLPFVCCDGDRQIKMRGSSWARKTISARPSPLRSSTSKYPCIGDSNFMAGCGVNQRPSFVLKRILHWVVDCLSNKSGRPSRLKSPQMKNGQ